MRRAPTATQEGVQFTSSLGALRVAPKHDGIESFWRIYRSKKMCKKKQIKYRPKGLSKEEQKYLDAQFRREIIGTLIVIVIGILVVLGLILMTKQAASL